MASASTSQSTKKLYPDGTVFVLHYARKWETLPADNLTNALAARAIKEATLLTEQPSIVAKEPAKRVGIDDAMSVYVSNTVATKKHRTLLAYTLATSDADDMMAYAKHNQLRPLGIVFAGSRHPGCTCYAPRSWLGRCSQTLAIDQSVDAVETGLSQVSAANSFFFSCPFGKTA